MIDHPGATVEIKALVPARDFEQSIAFYKSLGFTCASVGHGVAYFHCGNSSFLLQDFYVQAHADNSTLFDPSGARWRLAQNVAPS